MRRKSRLVAQNYCDEDAGIIPTKAPTIQRFSQRILLSLTASIPDMQVFTRDVTQAYIQRNKPLQIPVYIEAPKEMGLSEGEVLRVVRPLYGIPESGLHWYLTYLEYHSDKLGMHRATIDPCVMIKRDKGKLKGLVMLQVDDSLRLGSEEFITEEQLAAREFKSKEREFLSNATLDFNGIRIHNVKNGIRIFQSDKIQKLKTPDSQKSFASIRAMSQYIGVSTRPEICALVQLISPGN